MPTPSRESNAPVPPPQAGMRLYRLTPVLAADDPKWLGRTPAGPVVVRARSPADARVVAAEAELDFMDTDAKPSHGTSTTFASAFRDESLYAVSEITDSAQPLDGQRGVVEGDIGRDVIRHSDQR